MLDSMPRFDEQSQSALDASNAGDASFWSESAGHTSELHCAGYLDLGSRRALHDALFELVRGAPTLVIVDLGAVPMLDAGAIGELVGARRLLGAWDGRLRVRSPSNIGRKVLDLFDLGDLVSDDRVLQRDDPGEGAARRETARRGQLVDLDS